MHRNFAEFCPAAENWMAIKEIHTHNCNDNDKLDLDNDGLAILGRLGHCVAVFVCLRCTQMRMRGYRLVPVVE